MPHTRRVAHVGDTDPILSCSDGSTWYLSPTDWARAVTCRASDELAFYEAETKPFDRRILHAPTGFVAEAMQVSPVRSGSG